MSRRESSSVTASQESPNVTGRKRANVAVTLAALLSLLPAPLRENAAFAAEGSQELAMLHPESFAAGQQTSQPLQERDDLILEEGVTLDIEAENQKVYVLVTRIGESVASLREYVTWASYTLKTFPPEVCKNEECPTPQALDATWNETILRANILMNRCRVVLESLVRMGMAQETGEPFLSKEQFANLFEARQALRKAARAYDEHLVVLRTQVIAVINANEIQQASAPIQKAGKE